MVTHVPFLIARITDDHDFLKLKELSSVHEGWRLEYDKNGIKIWSRSVSDASIKIFKVWAVFSGINSSDLYNSLMDPIYRRQWDSHVIVAYEIGYLNPNNAITYYAASCPPPLKSRDFVLQTSWLDLNTEHFMLNHSVCHKDHPPRPGFIRAVSYFTGYYIRAVIDDGCELTFVTQTDPQGIIPAWIVNKCTQIFAPRFIRQVERAAFAYRAWKSQNNPNYLPWQNPEQMKAPKISVADCVPSAEERASPFFRDLLQKYLKHEGEKLRRTENTRESLQIVQHHIAMVESSKASPLSHDVKSPQNSEGSIQDENKVRKKKKSIFEGNAKKKSIVEENAKEKIIVEEKAKKKSIVEENTKKKSISEENTRKKSMVENNNTKKKSLIEENTMKKSIIEERIKSKNTIEETTKKKNTVGEKTKKKS